MNSMQSNKTAVGFDFRSNILIWRLFFRSSVSYPCLWTQNSFSTSKKVIDCLRILKTLHLFRLIDPVLICNDAMLRELGRRLSDHTITDNHTSITVYQRIKSTHPDGWVQQNNDMAVVKCKCYDKVPKYCSPWAFHRQDFINNIPFCLER